MEKEASSVQKNARTIGSIKRKVKATLSSPYHIQWPSINQTRVEDMLQKLQRVCAELKPIIARERVKRRIGKKKVPKTSALNSDQQKLRRGMRDHFVIGINAVTRRMERGQLHLALICRSTKDAEILTDHMKLLSATRSIPAAALRGLDTILSPILEIKTVHAVGFKKIQQPSDLPLEMVTHFNGMVEAIVDMIPSISVPWLVQPNVDLTSSAKQLVEKLFPPKQSEKSHEKLAKGEMEREFINSRPQQTSQLNKLDISSVIKPDDKNEYSTGVKGQYKGQQSQKSIHGNKRILDEGFKDGNVGKKLKTGSHSSLVPVNIKQVVQGNKVKKKKKNKGKKKRMANMANKYKYA